MRERRKLTDLECKTLISEVQSRPCLWNDRHINFKHSAVTKKLWEEIGSTMNLPGDECQKKWKNLKDTFRKIVRSPQSKSGSASRPLSKKWKFATPMEFTRDVVLPSPIVANFTSSSVEEEEEEKEGGEEATPIDRKITETSAIEPNNQEGSTSSCPEDDDVFSRPHRSKRSLSKRKGQEKRMKKLEEKEVNAILNVGKQANAMGDDHHFFLSLLPYVSRLGDLEKLQLRIKIQNCVLEAVREHETRKARQKCPAHFESSATASSYTELENTSLGNETSHEPTENFMS